MRRKKYGLAAFVPMFVFLGLYLGCGIFYTITGTAEQPWNQFPRHAAILGGIVVAFFMNRMMPLPEKVKKFCRAAGDEGTIMMCMIFLVAGAFSGICTAMDGVDSVVNLGLSLVPTYFILPGIFVITALVATAIGTSSGALVAIAPLPWPSRREQAPTSPCILPRYTAAPSLAIIFPSFPIRPSRRRRAPAAI